MKEIVWHRAALKELQKIPKEPSQKIFQKVTQLQIVPYSGEKLTGTRFPFRRLKVGDYRVIYLVEEDRIRIYRIGPRGSIYKRLR